MPLRVMEASLLKNPGVAMYMITANSDDNIGNHVKPSVWGGDEASYWTRENELRLSEIVSEWAA